MPLIHRLTQLRQEHPLGIRLLAAILVCSSLATLFATATQLYFDYRTERSLIDERIEQIETSYLDTLSASLWAINPQQVQLQLEGMKQLPDVLYLQLNTQFDERFEAGQPPMQGLRLEERNYALSHTTQEGKVFELGNLQLVVTLEGLYQRLTDRILVILASQAIKTFLVSAFILFIFHYLVTQHLGSLARYARRLRLEQMSAPLALQRAKPAQTDELDEVVTAFNDMQARLHRDLEARIRAEEALAALNEQLEERVTQRTQALATANAELQATLTELRATQTRLVESEKLAALGDLVAGVAHEISTPIGIGYTAASYLQQEAEAITSDTPDAAAKLRNMTLESSRLIGQHLERAARLISAFKQVSVDQSSEQRRRFELKEYLQEILTSLQPRLRRLPHQIRLDCADGLSVDSYPGALYQILSNLILNSLTHGFADGQAGEIELEVRNGAQSLELHYRDNGCGMNAEQCRRVFEPFYTTKRNQGCSGLGMQIVHNLVHQLFKGEIVCRSEPGQGVYFLIRIPITGSAALQITTP